ncbi:MAG: bifunctional N-acetylglucosamine-1-phosphate uridyltransferase/glucosamine-1-phosphate acetyltransferase [Planctomycetota bacterium]|nr:NTP transferase domain-containing protein [Planctomycetota bacterium]MDE2215782.1 bifunctional N-acetylglucosamine-1-phosphate uridyltransferase/glucosamine-1-phosphate acetyltransferase [Planctomycetota bacterium]
MGKITALILAAGKGTRMRSSMPKALHEVCGMTLLECVIEAVQGAEISGVVVIVGDKKDAVKDILKGISVEIIEQREQLGTAHAVMSARNFLSHAGGVVVVLNGDTALIKPQTLKRLIAANAETDADATLLTAYLDKPQGYGRILRDANGRIKGIIEENEAGADELKIKEINVGIYVFKVASLLKGLDEIVPHNKKGEFYLTDIVSILYGKGKKIKGLESSDTAEALGVNTQLELATVNQIRRSEIIRSLMDRGVTFIDPTSTFIENHVEIGEGTKVYPFTYICKNVVIGQRCHIGPFVFLTSGTKVGDDANVQNMLEEGGPFF